ncbi:MAG: TonB-dependent receptor, partial [Gemmatimonadetes bacterium]|nr:TonB-dependent receptor [Gemmatimonadota bacterium]
IVTLGGRQVASLRDRQNNEIRGQGKLTFDVGNARKLSAEYLFSRADNGWYHHAFSRTGFWSAENEHWWFEPIDSTYTYYNGPAHVSDIRRRGDQYKLVYTHPAGERSFFKARAGVFRSRFKEAVADKRPEEYVPFTGDPSERDPVNLFYAVTGDYPIWEVHDTRQCTGRLDYQTTAGEPSDPLGTTHEFKAGFTVDYYDLFKDAREFPSEDNPEGTAFNRYAQKAVGGSAYVRNRLRYRKSLVVTAGLRLDLFDPGEDAVRTGNERHRNLGLATSGVSWTDRVKRQVSPRLGVSYPITDVSVLHFTYGRFFQLPNLEFLYDFQEADNARGQQVGNPFLEPETQISYQFGVRRRLSDHVMIDASIFFKDIFGLIGTTRLEAAGAQENDDFTPITFVNQDYGSVRGLELTVRKRFSGYWQAGLTYTLSRATGSSSDVNQGLIVIEDGQDREPIREVPLAWDRTHLLNAHLYFADPGVWGLNFDLAVSSGAPATPIRIGQRNVLADEIGTLRLPGSVRVSFRANKQYELYGEEFRLFLEGRNLLDRKNPATHYPNLFPNPDSEYYREYFTEYGQLGGAYNLSDTIGLAEDVLVPLDDPRVWGPPRSFRAGVQYEW